jgi:hypothetical protein
LQAAGIKRSIVLPRTSNLLGDIQSVRAFIARCWFDEKRTDLGRKLLGHYRVEMDEKLAIPKPRPVKDGSDHCADAFRTLVAGERYLDTSDGWDQPIQQGVRRGRR